MGKWDNMSFAVIISSTLLINCINRTILALAQTFQEFRTKKTQLMII